MISSRRMNDEGPVRLSLGGTEDVEDAILARLNQRQPIVHELADTADGYRGGGGGGDADEGDASDDDEAEDGAPFDVEVAKPRAIDVARLYALSGRAIPDEVKAALGPARPLLLCHSVTPFHRPGRNVSSVWGLGYQSRLRDVNADTIGFQPTSAVEEVGSVEQELAFGVGAGGELSVPKEALTVGNALPGIQLEGATLSLSTHQRFALAISMTLTLRSIQAGPVGAGGVRWNIYRQKNRIDEMQALFQTLLVPKDVKILNVEVQTWVRSKGFLGIGSKQWQSPWRAFALELARV